MRTSERCKAFIKDKEKCRLRAYPDPKTGGEPYTCGWGSTLGVCEDTVWTQQQADARFEADIAATEQIVLHYVSHEMTQGQFDAFVSIFYNVGPGNSHRDGIGRLKNGNPSTLLRLFNAGDVAGCEAHWPDWCSPGSAVERGLRARRYEELSMFRGEEVSL